ncbi:MAG: DNA-processing protein DprA [Hyphomicrobiaceae bacterium]|nr:DNA-processing protein DprA [Hyphomicrobiaceae bacterium]
MARKADAKPRQSDGQRASLFTAAPLPVAPLDDDGRLACLRLIRSENVGPVSFRELINRHGGAHAALDALPEHAARAGRRHLRLCPPEQAEQELEVARLAGAVPLFTIEPGYPARLAAIEAPPPLIYVKGRPELLSEPSVAMVGAREASAAGMKLARIFARGLADAGLVIVSGLARGIDAAAHEQALHSGTVAVLAGGLDIVYPPEHAQLHARIGTQGCLVSELPCGFSPRGRDFPRRNRLISAIALGVLVVEAARRSGSLTTARHAVEQNRDVFAIPGNPLDPRAEGTNHLLKSGAILVTDPADVLEHLRRIGGHGPGAFREVVGVHPDPADPADRDLAAERALPSPEEPRDDEQARVLTALGAAPIDIDEIARTTGVPIRTVRMILLDLDLAGRIERHGAHLVSLRM